MAADDETFLISMRSDNSGGATVFDAQAYKVAGLSPTGATPILMSAIGEAASSRRVVFVSHGFNVPWERGIISAARMHSDLRGQNVPFPLGADSLFVGVLWPGDWWIPAINYPTEAEDAVNSGRRLAAAINLHFRGARRDCARRRRWIARP